MYKKNISPGSPPAPPKKVQAMYDYEPEDDEGVDMICLEEGDVVDILKKDKDGWTKIKKADGTRGLVPSSYLGSREK